MNKRRWLKALGWAALVAAPLLLWWGVSWGRAEASRRVVAALQERAARLGWEVEVGGVEVDWVGRVTVSDIYARGPMGGTVRVRSVRATLPPSRWWSGPHRPDFVLIEGVTGETSLDELWESRARLQKRASSGPSGGGDAALTLHLSDLKLSVQGLERIGSGLENVKEVRVEAKSVVVGRDGEGVVVSVDGVLPQQDALFGGAALPFRAQARMSPGNDKKLSASWAFTEAEPRLHGPRDAVCSLRGAEMSADLAAKSGEIRFDRLRCEHPRVGRAGLTGVQVAAEGEDVWRVSVEGVRVEPGARWGFIRAISVGGVGAVVHAPSLTKPSTWRLDGPVTLQQPDAEVDVAALLDGPVRRRSPRAARLASEVMARLGLQPLTTPSADAEQRSAPSPTPSPTSDTLTASTFLQNLSDNGLPPIKIEDARLTLRFDPSTTWRLTGIDFDATQQASERRHYEVGFRAGGTSTRLILDLPTTPAESPRVRLDLQGVPLSDLFRIAGLRPPPKLGGTADLDLSLHRAPDGDWFLEGRAALRDGQFHHPKVSEQRIHNINLSAQGRLRYRPKSDHLWLEAAQVASGPLSLDVVAEVSSLQKDPTLTFALSNPALPCAAIPAAIPDGALESIQRVTMSGVRASPSIRGSMRVLDPMTFELDVKGFPGDCAIAALPPYDVTVLNDPKYIHTTTYTSIPEGIRVGPGTGPKSFTPLSSLPTFLPSAMFMTEDIRFFDHGGVRVEQFVRAVRLNLTAGRYVYGGSSLTQQLIKNLLLHRRKTLSRKLEEVLIAWHLEDFVTKERILELYINCIEFGPDIYGITQAAAFYFDKKPQHLTPVEAAFLASLKASPRHGGEFYTSGFPAEKRGKRIKEILLMLARSGFISPAEVIASYPWIPTFVYPSTGDTKDFRNVWLARRRAQRRPASP